MGEVIRLDSDWLHANPLPEPDHDADKNERGRVLVIGGSRNVPGAMALTAEAALRAGAGKVRIATIESAALPLGVAMPECAVFALPESDAGEIGNGCEEALAELVGRCDAIVAGPAMMDELAAGIVVDALVAAPDCTAPLILDAAALTCLAGRAEALAERRYPAILTPHAGEMAKLVGCDDAKLEADRATAVAEAARRYRAICVLKGPNTLVGAPDGTLLSFAGGGVGLATGGSGDVLAGIVSGLAARGAEPLRAAAWAVWLHGEAGRRCGEQIGPFGFLARELLAHVPALMRGV